MTHLSLTPLPLSYYSKPTLELARDLLGCTLVKITDEGKTSGIIVETEAYIGPQDRAAHSYNNRRTKRTEIMFDSFGHVYTYLMHTHCLFNIVSGGRDEPEAILIRAIEPTLGHTLMQERRGLQNSPSLTNGPGKLTKAMGITMADYGKLLPSADLYITTGINPDSISAGKRIGISNSGEAKDYPWRFWITGNPYVSRHQKGQVLRPEREASEGGTS